MPCVQRGKGTAISMCLQPGGDCSLLAPKENQKGRRCPEGMKAPVGLLSRRPVCEANAACLARQGHGDFDALQPGVDCSLLAPKENQKSASDFDALDPRIKGCSPLIIPKQKSKRKNASRFAKRIFRASPIRRPLSRCATAPRRGASASRCSSSLRPLPVKKQLRKARGCVAMKAPVGLSSGRTVLR